MPTPEAVAPSLGPDDLPRLLINPGLIPVRGITPRAVLRESRGTRVPSMLAS